jgi:hypothetical protein
LQFIEATINNLFDDLPSNDDFCFNPKKSAGKILKQSKNIMKSVRELPEIRVQVITAFHKFYCLS